MKKYHALVFSLVIILALSLSACERSATTPLPEDGESVDFPIPERTTSPMDELNNIATMTAMAASDTTPSDAGDATPIVSSPGEKSKPTATKRPSAAKPTAKPPTPTGDVKEYANPDTYTLKTGEFVYCIARRFNIAPATLLSANNLGSIVYPGTVLTIPKNAPVYNLGPRALRTHPTTYVVQAGDSVFSIACLFGDVDPRNIKSVNNLTDNYKLPVGKTIQIP